MASTTPTWQPLKAGDIVDLVSPGFRPAPGVLEKAENLLKSWGLKPRRPKEIFGRDILCSNRDDRRAQFLIEALEASDSRAVWCLRGGYGSLRLVPQLLKRRRPRFIQPKIFVGLSDVTTIHLFLNQVWGWPSIHGPLLDRLVNPATPKSAQTEMRRLVFGERSEIQLRGLKPLNQAAAERRVSNLVEGPVVGGNLATLVSSLGTQLKPSAAGSLVFFEDIGERGYRVDRLLEHLRQAGFFDRVRAVLFGGFTGGQEPDGSTTVPKVLRRFAESQSVPVLAGVPCGHGKAQRPIPFLTSARLDCRERSLTVSIGPKE
jgi:muramoyltetrapeptide carboxypeptidase